MQAEHVNIFIQATVKTFQTMLNVVPVKKKLFIKEDSASSYDISAIIGLSGKLHGFVVLSFPLTVAESMMELILGAEHCNADQDIADGVGELVNIITGTAKTELNKSDMGLSIALPNIIIGKNHTVWRMKDSQSVCVIFDSEIGEFAIEVCLKAD